MLRINKNQTAVLTDDNMMLLRDKIDTPVASDFHQFFVILTRTIGTIDIALFHQETFS
jgi:hypothetical protein